MDLIPGLSAANILIALVVAAVVMGVLSTIAAEYSSVVGWYDLRVEVQRMRVEQARRLAATAEAMDDEAEPEAPRVKPFATLPSIVKVEAPAAAPPPTRGSRSTLSSPSLLAGH